MSCNPSRLLLLLAAVVVTLCGQLSAMRMDSSSRGAGYLTGSSDPVATQKKFSAAAAASGGSEINHMAVAKFLPDGISRADKLQAFLECRKECIAKCDRLVYVYSTKKEFCHDCLRQCMIAILQQARSLGIDFSVQEEKMQGDSPALHDSSVGGGGGGGGDKRERRRRRKQKKNRNRRDRRHRRQRKEKQRQQQALLKNCIVH